MFAVLGLLLVVSAWAEDNQMVPSHVVEPIEEVDNVLANTKPVLVSVIFRHGDRTPDEEELALYPADEKLSKSVFFPYGMKSLTNKGKQRGFLVGKYLRQRYDGLISRLYLSDETVVRTTSYSRTQMTALTALAALYPPQPAQKWNPSLNWQPVPYNTPDFEDDDLMYWYNCAEYIRLRNAVYQEPEVVEWLEPYQSLFKLLQQKTGNNITTAEDVFFLDNLFQTLKNVGVSPPKWAIDKMPQIKEVTKIEYATEFFYPEMIRLSSGVLLMEILNATNSYIDGNTDQPKLRLYSAHENNVAALMAASMVFEPHQPNYGATFSMELRKDDKGKYYMMAVYSKDAGGPAKILPIRGCGNNLLCDYDTFVSIVKEFVYTKEEFQKHCNI